MSLLPLLDAHPGTHRAPARQRRTLRERIAGALRFARFAWEREPGGPPATALLAPEGIVPLGGPLSEHEIARVQDAWDRAFPPPLPESHPYPPLNGREILLPMLSGEGVIVLGPDGCIQVRRDTWTARADQTMTDLPAVRAHRYLDEMPGGTE